MAVDRGHYDTFNNHSDRGVSPRQHPLHADGRFGLTQQMDDPVDRLFVRVDTSGFGVGGGSVSPDSNVCQLYNGSTRR